MQSANSLIPIHSWHVNDIDIKLFENGKCLYYEVFDTIFRSSFSKTIDDTSADKQSLINKLRNCRVVIQSNQVLNLSQIYQNTWFPSFSQSYPTNLLPSFLQCYQTWNLNNYDVSLIRGNNELIWDVFNKSTRETLFLPFKSVSTVPSPRSHPVTIDIIEKIKNDSFDDSDEIHRLIDDFDVVQIADLKTLYTQRWIIYQDVLSFTSVGSIVEFIVKCFDPKGSTPYYMYTENFEFFLHNLRHFEISRDYIFSPVVRIPHNQQQNNKQQMFVEIEPKIKVPSVIDPDVIVSKFSWAVTLITHEGSRGNHALIAVEGVNDGFYNNNSSLINNARHVGVGEKFLYLAHFKPGIESGLSSPDDLNYETRTGIRMIASEKVKEMLTNIELEKNLPRNQRIQFNKYGHKVNGLRAYNCFTWAQVHLKLLGIEFTKKTNPSFLGICAPCATDYTEESVYYDNNKKQLEMI